MSQNDIQSVGNTSGAKPIPGDELSLITEALQSVDVLDLTVLSTLLLGAIVYLFTGKLWNLSTRTKDSDSSNSLKSAGQDKLRRIVKTIQSTGNTCIVFYGSQTGTG
ncbi:hypothetical protein EDB80DRAFT_875010 [Ilyonectria destructans]|nr:hypothetical protein EDB80DRAFT_875010 [Ilyonectria destructans]